MGSAVMIGLSAAAAIGQGVIAYKNSQAQAAAYEFQAKSARDSYEAQAKAQAAQRHLPELYDQQIEAELNRKKAWDEVNAAEASERRMQKKGMFCQNCTYGSSFLESAVISSISSE